MDILVTKIFSIFSLEYMLSVILASYFIIKVIDVLNGDKVVPTWMKRTITCFVGAILFAVFVYFTDTRNECLIASFFAAVFLYDSVIRELFRKLNIGYRNVDENTAGE